MSSTLEDIARDTLLTACGTLSTAALAVAVQSLTHDETVAEVSAALERLARSGTPLARKGPPVCRRLFGRTRMVRPWEWRAV